MHVKHAKVLEPFKPCFVICHAAMYGCSMASWDGSVRLCRHLRCSGPPQPCHRDKQEPHSNIKPVTVNRENYIDEKITYAF